MLKICFRILSKAQYCFISIVSRLLAIDTVIPPLAPFLLEDESKLYHISFIWTLWTWWISHLTGLLGFLEFYYTGWITPASYMRAHLIIGTMLAIFYSSLRGPLLGCCWLHGILLCKQDPVSLRGANSTLVWITLSWPESCLHLLARESHSRYLAMVSVSHSTPWHTGLPLCFVAVSLLA